MIWPFTKYKQQQKRIKELEDKVQQLLMDDLNMMDWSLNEYNGMDIKLEGSIVHIIAASLVEQFKGHNGINYVEFRFVDKETNEMYTLLMQKQSGLSPVEKAAKLEAELEALKKQNKALNQEVERLTRNPQLPH